MTKNRIKNLRSHPELLCKMSPEDRLAYAKTLVTARIPNKEADLQNACEEILAALDFWFLHLPCYQATKVIRAGIPDLVCCVDGQFVAIELKTRKGRVSKDQAREHFNLRRAGAWVAVCRSTRQLIDALDAVACYPVLKEIPECHTHVTA